MMIRTLLAAGILASSVMLPLTAHAYVEPEEVLNEGNYETNFYDPPPSKREIQRRVEEQQERSAAQREAGLNAAMEESGSAPDEEEPASAPDREDQTGTSDLDELINAIKELQEGGHSAAGAEEPTAEDLRDQRILERIREQQERDERAAYEAAIAAGQGETLHGGAPLADTGPAAVLTVIAVAGAVGETWRRVRRAEQKQR